MQRGQTSTLSQWPMELTTPEEVGMDSRRLDVVARLMDSWIQERRIAGGIVLAARRGLIAYRRVFGWADIEREIPMRDDTLFRLYSMTKPITCVATLMLYEECHFLLDDPVKWYMPDFANVRVRVKGADGADELVRPCRDITIHDLLTHTAGLGYDLVWEARKQGWTTEEFVRRVAQIPLYFHPGEKWHYSSAHDVLGRLIEVLSGQSLNVFFEERIFRPLGMTDTFFHVPPEKKSRLATLYKHDAEGKLIVQTEEDLLIDPPPPGASDFFSGGGGLIASTSDYLRFCQMLLNDGAWDGTRLLSRKTVELMRTDHLPPGHPPIQPYKFGYGLGVSVLRSLGEKQGLGSVGEFGWGGAACTEAWIDPQEELITLVMLQLRPSSPQYFTKKIKHAVYQAIAD